MFLFNHGKIQIAKLAISDKLLFRVQLMATEYTHVVVTPHPFSECFSCCRSETALLEQ